MPSVRDMRRRIRSVQNTGKVTNAMSLIAASKMRRAQISVTQGRPFAEKIQEIITHLAAQTGDDRGAVHPLLQERPVQRVGILVVSPDRGLCGGLVGNLNRAVGQFILDQAVPVTAIVAGRKSRDFMVRTGQDLKAVFTDLPERPELADTTAISHLIIDSYADGEVDEVYLAYTKFISTVTQTPVIERPPRNAWATYTSRTVLPCWIACYRASWIWRSITPCWSPLPASSRPGWSPCGTLLKMPTN